MQAGLTKHFKQELIIHFNKVNNKFLKEINYEKTDNNWQFRA